MQTAKGIPAKLNAHPLACTYPAYPRNTGCGAKAGACPVAHLDLRVIQIADLRNSLLWLWHRVDTLCGAVVCVLPTPPNPWVAPLALALGLINSGAQHYVDLGASAWGGGVVTVIGCFGGDLAPNAYICYISCAPG